MSIPKFLLIVSSLIAIATNSSANGDGAKSYQCEPFPVNRYSASFDPAQLQTLKVDPSTFSAVPLMQDEIKLGFVAKRETDHSYVVVPNAVKMNLVSWVFFTQKKHKKNLPCASRLVVTFQPETDSGDFDTLVHKVKALDPQAIFLRPIMQGVKVEFTLPFIGYLRRFDPEPVFPLGGVLVVWDLDSGNTERLKVFVNASQSPAALPGIILFRELQTGLTFGTSISIDRDRLLSSIIEISGE